MKLPAILAATLFAASQPAAAAGPLQAVAAVDLQRYAGTWHEQARLPMFFQRKCRSEVTATYTLRADGMVDVDNRCRDKDGRMVSAQGVARTVEGSTSRLEVRFAPAALSFLPFAWADYWVLELEPAYRWAVVGEPRRKYLWILSRDKALPESELQGIIDRVAAMGYDTARLIRATQP